jgi:hypothetical protein
MNYILSLNYNYSYNTNILCTHFKISKIGVRLTFIGV